MFQSFKGRVEFSDGDSVGVVTGKAEIRRGPLFGCFSAGKWRLLLLGGRDATNENSFKRPVF